VKAGNESRLLDPNKTILGIRFMTADAAAAVEQGLRGDWLSCRRHLPYDMERNVAYRDALLVPISRSRIADLWCCFGDL